MAIEERNAAMQRLLARLLDLSRQDTIPWMPTGPGDGFEYIGSEAEVAVRSRDGDDMYPFSLELLEKARGTIADSLTSGTYSTGPDPYDEEAQPWNDDLAELYYLARNRALHIDALAESLLVDLAKSTRDEPG